MRYKERIIAVILALCLMTACGVKGNTKINSKEEQAVTTYTGNTAHVTVTELDKVVDIDESWEKKDWNNTFLEKTDKDKQGVSGIAFVAAPDETKYNLTLAESPESLCRGIGEAVEFYGNHYLEFNNPETTISQQEEVTVNDQDMVQIAGTVLSAENVEYEFIGYVWQQELVLSDMNLCPAAAIYFYEVKGPLKTIDEKEIIAEKAQFKDMMISMQPR